MNKEEIRQFKSLLNQGILRHMNVSLDYKFQSELLKIIKDYEKVQQENKQLKLELLEKKCSDKDIEYKKRLKIQNNWNKLKEYLKEETRENDEIIKRCDQIIIKMKNESKKDTHQHKLIDICGKENVTFNKIKNKIEELEKENK